MPPLSPETRVVGRARPVFYRVVVEVLVRDVQQITSVRPPVFAYGRSELNANGRLLTFTYRIPIEYSGILVELGEVISGDSDGWMPSSAR
jgi:regulator of RNase E activity RraA